MQPRLLDSAPTSQSIASRRSSPRAARPISTIGRSRCASRRRTRCSRRCTHPALQLGDVRARRFGSSRQHTGGWCVARADTTYPSIHPSGPESESRVPSRFVLLEEGTPRALAERLPILLLRRSRVSGLSVDPCRARGARLLQLVAGYCRRRRVLACVRVRDVDASLPIARRPPSSIITLLLPPNVARTTRERLLPLFCSSAQQQESSPTPSCCREDLAGRAERSNRWPQVPKQLSLGLDYTNRPTDRLSSLDLPCISSTPRRAPAPTCIQSCLPYPSHLIPPRAAAPGLCHDALSRRRGVEEVRLRCGGAGGQRLVLGSLPPYKSSHGVLAARRIRPFRISTTRRGVQGGAFALQLGDLHAAAWVFGTPQSVYRACGIHFTPLQARWPARVPVLPSGPKSSSTPGFIGDLLYDATSWYSLVRRRLGK
ncbi:hypothetical protein B0H14DRAFT_1686690 [Mycena olivaceomarginata]|nr:hypothetical protein B0H14DRAFT_1686690 [Mycena olivaceomarginata]